MTRAGARRYLLSLEHLGYVRKDDRLFRLTPKVLELGYSFLSTVPLYEIAQPYLEWITRETGEITGLAVLDGNEIVHIAGSKVQRTLVPTLTIGRRFNALYTSSGRAMAAFLEPAQTEDVLRRCEVVALTQYSLRNKDDIREALKVVRRQGYALVDQEVEEGVRSISVPVLNKLGVPVAAVTTLTNIATISKKQLVDEILPVMQRIVPQLPTGAL